MDAARVLAGIHPGAGGIAFASTTVGGPDMWRQKHPCVYILASRRDGTLYVGVTSDLAQRVWQHKVDLVEGFTKRYGVHTLVYYEALSDMESAIVREKQLKKWNRAWKIELIEASNPDWRDLYQEMVG